MAPLVAKALRKSWKALGFTGKSTTTGIFFSHMILAVVIVPCVLRLVYLIWKERFQDHRRLARWVFRAWLYVSISGFVVYVLLYHVYGYV